MQSVFVYLSSFGAMVVLDALWLGIVAKSLYSREIGHLLADSPNWYAAALFYPLFCLGVVYFAVLPNVGAGLMKVVLQAALLGALCYATYDLTNYATLKDWTLLITVVDIAWGAFISAAVGVAGYYAWSLLR